MLTQVDVECDNPFYMSVVGASPRDSLILQSIAGLGPPDKNLFVGDYARDGGVYSGRRVTTRNPVLTIEINPNFGLGETVAGLRKMLYEAFNDPNPQGDDVTLIFHDDVMPDRLVTGYTEKFDAETFSADRIVVISMICPDPYVRDVTKTVITPTPPSPGWQEVPFNYGGDARAGFEATVLVQAVTPNLTIDNNGRKMFFTYPFAIDDLLYVCTVPGYKTVQLTRGGVTYDVLYTLSDDSPWLALHTQSNAFQVYGDDPEDHIAAVTNLSYTQLYWGL